MHQPLTGWLNVIDGGLMKGRAIAVGPAIVVGFGILTVTFAASAAETGVIPPDS